MARIYIGCAGWDYKDWIGPFYPKLLESHNRLGFYTKYFNVIEINNTFYSLPKFSIVQNWSDQVPSDFKFTVKVWQEITHNFKDANIEDSISQFFYRLSPLKEKTFAYLLQFPPWFKYNEKHFHHLKYLIRELPTENNYIIELRDNSWFNEDLLHEVIGSSTIILGTTYMPGIKAYYMPRQNSYYIRLIGDRELTVFDRIQRDQKENLRNLVDCIEILKKSPSIYEIFIIVNNHFQGNAPESVNMLKEKLNLPVKTFHQQKKLSDYF
ncbi:MAG TPA: DUF72 domain-containing protein [Candidatus Nanopelagicaceae bacterium]|nr:DUF72 domain-containing protein [Candidatus Nanopelagicaceae bacterium]